MAAIAVESITRTGLEAAYTNVAASQTFANDGKDTFIHVVNGATAMNCVIVTTSTSDGLAVADRTVAIGSSEEFFIGPFPIAVYGSTVTVTFSETSDGTIAVLKLPTS